MTTMKSRGTLPVPGMLAHSQGTFYTVVHLGINTTAPAVGLSRVPQKTTKKKKLRHVS